MVSQWANYRLGMLGFSRTRPIPPGYLPALSPGCWQSPAATARRSSLRNRSHHRCQRETCLRLPEILSRIEAHTLILFMAGASKPIQKASKRGAGASAARRVEVAACPLADGCLFVPLGLMELDRIRIAKCDTLDDVVREQFALSIRCMHCARRTIVTPRPLLAVAILRGWPRHLVALGKHLRCASCNTRFPELLATSMPVDSPPIGPASEAAYRAHRGRLR